MVVEDSLFSFGTRFRWPMAVVYKWSLFRGRFRTYIDWARFGVVVVDRWSLAQV